MITRDDLKLPSSFTIIAGADTGTYMSGVIAAISPDFDCYFLEEFPNYRYVGDGTIELTGETVGEWMKRFGLALRYWTKEKKNSAWVDANTTFKTEIAHGLRFKMNKKVLEVRTEVFKEYMRNSRIHLAPWLEVLPYEMEEAKYPDHENVGSGRLVRVKHKDHTLDCAEHICSRRPHPDTEDRQHQTPRGIDRMQAQFGQNQPEARDIDGHLGAL